MSRQITTTVYRVSELPTEQAKTKARNWYRAHESCDPAWACEHRDSRLAARKALADKSKSLADTIQDSFNCVWTGYTDDGIFADNMKGREQDGWPTANQVENWYAHAWDAEMDSRNQDDYIDEQLEANEYEFHLDGSLVLARV